MKCHDCLWYQTNRVQGKCKKKASFVRKRESIYSGHKTGFVFISQQFIYFFATLKIINKTFKWLISFRVQNFVYTVICTVTIYYVLLSILQHIESLAQCIFLHER